MRLGRRRREARDVRHHQERASSSTTRRRASRRRGSTGATRSWASRRARTAARTRSRGPTCSSSACRTSRCCPATRTSSWEDIIAATDRGIAIIGDGSFSIDQQRYNAQFGGQVFYEIKGGKIVGMLKDVAYQMRTPEFWNSMDMIGGKKSYLLGGAFGDGKGQPGQINAVSHGCVPSPLPQHQRHQHRERRHERPARHSFDRRGAYLSRENARRSPSACWRIATADETRVTITSGARGNTRFAVNQISTRRRQLRRHVVRSQHVRQAQRERDHEQARRRVAQACRRSRRALAKLAPEDPEAMPRARPADVRTSRADWSDATASTRSGGARARRSRAVTEPSRAGEARGDRLHRIAGAAYAIANNKGLFAYSRADGRRR